MFETELAVQIADRYISIQTTDSGYDYSVMDLNFKVLDGGVYDNPDVTIQKALSDIVDDLKSNPDYNGTKGNIAANSVVLPVYYDLLMEKAEAANRIA